MDVSGCLPTSASPWRAGFRADLGVVVQAELEDLCMAVLEPNTYKQVYAEVSNLWGPQQDGLAALNELSEAQGRSCMEAALQDRRASSATASTSGSSSPGQQQALDSVVADALRLKGPRRKGRTVRMSVTPAMMNAIWAARRMTSAAASQAGARPAQPHFASAFTSSSASMSSFDSDDSSSSIPSNSRTGRTLHTRREWAEMKRTQQVLQDMLNAQATIDLEAEKGMPWLTSEQRQVRITSHSFLIFCSDVCSQYASRKAALLGTHKTMESLCILNH